MCRRVRYTSDVMAEKFSNLLRICRKCRQQKPLKSFVKAKSCKGGRGHTCKECKRILSARWYAKNREWKNADSLRRYREKRAGGSSPPA